MTVSASDLDTIVIALVSSAFTAGLTVGAFRTELRAISNRLSRIEGLFEMTLRGNTSATVIVPPPDPKPGNAP